jgi:zinc protease
MRIAPPRWTPRFALALLLSAAVAPAGLLAQDVSGTAEAEAARAASLDTPLPFSPRVTVGRLDNGLRYYIRENQEPAGRAELRLVVNAGSILEDDDQLGLAHVLEHMAFNGTENFARQELVTFMESIGMRLGAGLNASTSYDQTVYMLRVPTDVPEHVETAFQILEDWAHGLTLDPEEIDRERGVVMEEWRARQGAGARVGELQNRVMYGDSRYADRSPIGTPESIQGFEHEALRRFYDDWYRPDLMAVVAVGDFDATRIEALVREHFEAIPASVDPRERAKHDIPVEDGTIFSIASDPQLTTTRVSLISRRQREVEPTVGGVREGMVAGLYAVLLNRRFQEAARAPDAPFLSAAAGVGSLGWSVQLFQIGASVPDGEVERGLRGVLAEIERAHRFGFTESELAREKTATLRRLELTLANRDSRTSASFAARYVNSFLSDTPAPGLEYQVELGRRFIPEITLEEVNEFGRGWAEESSRVVLVSGPERGGLAMPAEAELAVVLAEAPEADLEPYVDRTPAETLLAELPVGSEVVAERIADGGLIEWDLANGIRVVLMPTDHDADRILFRGFSPGGHSLASDEAFVPARTAVRAIAGGGVGAFDANDLRRVLTGTVASANPFIAEFEEGVSGTAAIRDLETMFQLIYLRFTAPRADEAFFRTFVQAGQSALGNRDSNPATVFGDAFNRIMTQDHPRERPETVEMLPLMDLDQSLAFYRDRFSDASDYIFIFVGSLDPETMRPLVERYLGALPVTGRQESWRDLGIRPPRGVVEETVYAGLEPRSQTRMMFTGSFDIEDAVERIRLTAVGILAQARLRNVLREKLGGTYTVSVGSGYGARPEPYYSLAVSFGSDPGRVDELTGTLLQELVTLREEGPTAAEVASVIQVMLRGHESNLEQNSYWIDRLSSFYGYGLSNGMAVLETYPAEIGALTPADLTEAFGRYFDLENYVRVTLLPEEAAGAAR